MNYITHANKRLIRQNQEIWVRNIEGGDHSLANLVPRHNSFLPNTIRAFVVSPSNCGKTNFRLSLIESPSGIKFENIYVFSKSLNQPKYEYLEKLIKPTKGMGYYTFSQNDEVLPPAKAKENSIMIFDDVTCEKQNNIRSYFCMGRHKNIDSFYLCQTYTHIPKHLIRDNGNMIIMFKQDDLNMRHIYRDHVNTNMLYDSFMKISQKCWSDKYGLLIINKDNIMEKERFRTGFNEFVIISEY